MEYLPLQSSPDKIQYLSLEWRKDITGKNEENLNKIRHLVNSIGSVLIYYFCLLCQEYVRCSPEEQLGEEYTGILLCNCSVNPNIFHNKTTRENRELLNVEQQNSTLPVRNGSDSFPMMSVFIRYQ